VVKIKVNALKFEVIPIIQNSLSQTHNQLESILAPPCGSDDILNQHLSMMTKKKRKRKDQICFCK